MQTRRQSGAVPQAITRSFGGSARAAETPAREKAGQPSFRAICEAAVCLCAGWDPTLVGGTICTHGLETAPGKLSCSPTKPCTVVRRRRLLLAPPRRRCRWQSGGSSENARWSPPHRPEDRAPCRRCRHARWRKEFQPADAPEPRWPRTCRVGWPRSWSSV
jgi:hypothetical protein